MRNLHHNIVANVSDILLDIDGVLLDGKFDNLFWEELVPLELSLTKNISIEDAKTEIYKTASEVKGTLPWYELEYWEKRYDIDLLKVANAFSSKISFLPKSEKALTKLSSLDKRIILLTNCDPRLLAVKAKTVPFMKYVDGCMSAIELGTVKEKQDFWNTAFQHFQINPKESLFADDSIGVVKSSIKAGIKNSFQVLEPTGNGSVAHEPQTTLTIKNISELV